METSFASAWAETGNSGRGDDHGEAHPKHRWLNFGPGESDDKNERRAAFAPKIVLVPVTMSSSSDAALTIARNLAGEFKARLVMLHVVQLNIAGEERGIPRTRLLNDLAREAKSKLLGLGGCMSHKVDTEIIVSEGRPAEAIIEVERHLRADMIVMCAHGYRSRSKWLHRNTAQNVIRNANCKILLVLPGREDGTTNLMFVDRAPIHRFFTIS